MSQVEIPAVDAAQVVAPTAQVIATPVVATPKPAQTRKEKLTARATALHGIITKNTEEYNSLLDTLKAIATIENVKVGDRASGTFGRADTARQVEGQVVGINQTETGISIKVLVGTGFDTDVLVLNESNITSIIPA